MSIQHGDENKTKGKKSMFTCREQKAYWIAKNLPQKMPETFSSQTYFPHSKQISLQDFPITSCFQRWSLKSSVQIKKTKKKNVTYYAHFLMKQVDPMEVLIS